MFVTKDLDVRVWTSLAQRPERWQSKNEIADRATADNQNAVHAFTVATLYQRRNPMMTNSRIVRRSQTAVAALNIA